MFDSHFSSRTFTLFCQSICSTSSDVLYCAVNIKYLSNANNNKEKDRWAVMCERVFFCEKESAHWNEIKMVSKIYMWLVASIRISMNARVQSGEKKRHVDDGRRRVGLPINCKAPLLSTKNNMAACTIKVGIKGNERIHKDQRKVS